MQIARPLQSVERTNYIETIGEKMFYCRKRGVCVLKKSSDRLMKTLRFEGSCGIREIGMKMRRRRQGNLQKDRDREKDRE